MYLKKESEALLKVFNNKIHRASKKVQENFTFDNVLNMFFLLESALINQCFIGYYKYNLNNLLSNPCFLLYCYHQLKQDKTVSTNDIFIENVTLSTILSLSNRLVSGTYKPKPVSRTFICKANGKMRPLGIASNVDKLIQKTIFIFIDPIFEKYFLKCSHGFRKNRNCHTSLSSIYYNWVGTKWFIEADFVNCFDRNSHPILMDLINKKFHNYRVSQIIYSLISVGYINFGTTLIDSELERSIGTGSSLLSPLFCNILLHELDYFSISLCNKVFNAKRGISSGWLKVWRRYLNTPWEDVWHLIKSKVDSAATIKKALQQIRSYDPVIGVRYCGEDKNLRRLTYTRYADDFLFGYIGTKKEAISILIAINHFVDLFLGMRLNIDKTRVRHHEKGVYFLGYKIWKKYGLTVTWERNSIGYKQRNESTRLNFSVPLEKLFQSYSKRGFIMKAKKKTVDKYVGKRQDKWLFFADDASIIHRFNSLVRGIANYYSGSTQQGVLGKLYYALKKSAALTIAHRNSKRNAAWALKKYGKEMLVKNINKWGKESSVEFLKPKSQKVNWQRSPKGQISALAIPFGVPIPDVLGLVCSAADLPCAIPNCPNNAKEWHQIKHRKRIKKKNSKIFGASTAKQIAVCKQHYLLIHNGKYDGPSLRKLRGYISSDLD
jgi:retron-type reverse transcriptase